MRRPRVRGMFGRLDDPGACIAGWGIVLAGITLEKPGHMIIDALIFFMFVAVIVGIGLLFTYATRKRRERHRN